MKRLILLPLMILLLLAACSTPQEEPTPTAQSQVVAKLLATVYLSPTANAAEQEATRIAISPTPSPVPSTHTPTEPPYVGTFAGEVEPDIGMVHFTEPLFAAGATPLAPTADMTVCLNPIDSIFLSAWQTNSAVSEALACPIQGSFGFFGQLQLFENGLIYRREETNEFWAILLEGGSVGEYFFVENPPPLSTEGLEAPRGMIVPDGRFGSVWSSVEGLRERIGFAITDPQRVAVNIQRFESGSFFLDASSGQIFALIVDSRMYGPFLAPTILEVTATPLVDVTFTATPE